MSRNAQNAELKWSKNRRFNYIIRCFLNLSITDSFSIVEKRSVFVSVRTKE